MLGRVACGRSFANPSEIGVNKMVPVLAVTTFSWLIFAVIWIAIAFWPARVAGRKGHSFIGYFIFSLFFFPAALLMAYIVRPRRV